eukprot:m.262228 g.262228  ORF g.262228 m.262228 type:complete len:773 (+) comp44826_c0_seq1:107-2425(+)
MINIMKNFPSFIVLAVLQLSCLFPTTTLGVDFVVPQQILIGPNALPQEQRAAQELQKYLQQIAGTPGKGFPVTNSTPSRNSLPYFAVGYDAVLAIGAQPQLFENLGLEGFVVTLKASLVPESIAVSGGKDAPRGTLYAVNSVLRSFGVDFFSIDTTFTPSDFPKTQPSGLETKFLPALEYRENNEWQCEHDVDYDIHMGWNKGVAELETPSNGKSVVYATPPGFVHTSYGVLDPTHADRVPPPQLWSQHREWFWPQTDAGNTTYGQLCWSNASLVQYVIGKVKEILAAQPDATIISVSQNDNGAYCQTPEELAIIKAEGTPGGALFRAINVIADGIKDDYPNVALDTLAYQWSRPAPAIMVPRPNVIIRLCSIECNFGAPLTDPSNAAFQTDITNWGKISKRTYIWNYITNFGMFLAPFPNWFVLGPNVRFYKEHGVRGIFQEGAYTGPGGDMNELKDFILSRMMWDPTLNDSLLIDEFLTGYYGAEAGPLVRIYLDTMHESVQATQFYMHENFDGINAPFLTADVVMKSATAFASALKATSTSQDQTYHNHVLASSMSIYWVVMPRWAELTTYAKFNNIQWPLESTLTEAFTTFARAYNYTASRYGANPTFAEGRPGSLAELRSQLLNTTCPQNWSGAPCVPTCATGTLASLVVPASVNASHSWQHPPTLSGVWNSGGYAPQWIEFTLGTSAKAFGGVSLTVEMVPNGMANHSILLDNQIAHSWVGNITAGEILTWTPPPGTQARSVRILTTVSPSWVSWSTIDMYTCDSV